MEATENVKSSDANAKTQTADIPQVDYPYIPSNYPRFTEAARYWLQWAGAPRQHLLATRHQRLRGRLQMPRSVGELAGRRFGGRPL